MIIAVVTSYNLGYTKSLTIPTFHCIISVRFMSRVASGSLVIRLAPPLVAGWVTPRLLSNEAMAFARAAFSINTQRAYAAQWRLWASHCQEKHATALPAAPEAVANWIAARASAGQAIATLRTAIAAIRVAHLAADAVFDTRHPALQLVLKGIARQQGTFQRQALPVRGDIVSAILVGLGDAPMDLRDAAVLALGYCFARRRSELVGLDLARRGTGTGILILRPHTLEVQLAQSKGQGSEPEIYAVPRHPNAMALAAIERWIAFAEIKPGEPVLRRVLKGGHVSAARLDPQSVALILKRRVIDYLVAHGQTPAEAAAQAKAYSGHSLRVGFAVSAAEAGADIGAIQRALGHRTPVMSARYAKPAQLLKTSPHLLPGVALAKAKTRRRSQTKTKRSKA